MSNALRYSYVIPGPTAYTSWDDFRADVDRVQELGYDSVEIQVADPRDLDQEQLQRLLAERSFSLCAVQTGGTYGTRGNCLTSRDETVRERTLELLFSFVDFAERFDVVLVFGSLQGRLSDEPDAEVGRQRIREALARLGDRAAERGVVVAYEPVNHMEVGWNNRIADISEAVRELNCPGVRMMIDTFHMNIEEQDMLTPVAPIADILAHVHLSETNRDVLGTGHWPTAAFLQTLAEIKYTGTCSVGVYNTCLPRQDCMERCMRVIRESSGNG